MCIEKPSSRSYSPGFSFHDRYELKKLFCSYVVNLMFVIYTNRKHSITDLRMIMAMLKMKIAKLEMKMAKLEMKMAKLEMKMAKLKIKMAMLRMKRSKWVIKKTLLKHLNLRKVAQYLANPRLLDGQSNSIICKG